MTAFSEMPIGSRVDAQQLHLPNRGEYIRFWHKADITNHSTNVRFVKQRTPGYYSGTERTLRSRLVMAVCGGRRATDGLNWTWTSGPSPNIEFRAIAAACTSATFRAVGQPSCCCMDFRTTRTFMTTSFHT